MKKLTSLAFATLLASTGTAAFAEQDVQKQAPTGPVAMSDTQMDNVAAGALFVAQGGLVNVDLGNVAVLNNVNVAAAVGAAVQALTNQSNAAAHAVAFVPR